MEVTNFVLVFVTFILTFQFINANENDDKVTETPPYNPLENLILYQNQNDGHHRMKRQYGPYERRNPYPVPILIGGGAIGGYGGGFGRGFGERGFGGRGFGGRGFGGRGFGGRGGGFGGRGGGIGGRGGFGGGRGGRGGGFGGGRGGGFGGGRGGRG